MLKFLKKTWLVLRYLSYRMVHDGLTYRAASLAYATILAIVPIMIAIVTILSYFPIFTGAASQIQQFILTNFVAESAKAISQHLTHFVSNVRYLSQTNLYLLLALDVLMLYNIHAAFNAIWHARHRWHLSLSFLIYFIVLMLSPLVFGGILVLGGFIYKLPFIEQLIQVPLIQKPLFVLAPYGLTLGIFTIFNWILPSCRVKFQHALLGGIITTLAFELAKNLFAFYLGHFHTYRQLYGTLATFPVFLIWLYVSWLIILLGALVTHAIAVGIPKHWQQKLTS